MKIIELLSGINTPITNEEAAVLNKFNESPTILKTELEPREQLLANQLVVKEVLSRTKDEKGKIRYAKKIR